MKKVTLKWVVGSFSFENNSCIPLGLNIRNLTQSSISVMPLLDRATEPIFR